MLDGNQRWSCNTIYRLTQLTFVNNGVLTIEPGTVITAEGQAALFVTRSAKLVALGTAAQPIVFTSYRHDVENQSASSAQPGDWGGVVLLGAAPVNVPGGLAQIEGFPDTPEAGYGGQDPEHACGDLRYVRIEFAGFEVAVDNELSGLTLAGCGRETTVDYLQVHAAADDGVQMLGGAPYLSHLVLTEIDDDSLDWANGYAGTGQFIVARHALTATGYGIEADNYGEDDAALPRSNPTLANLTLIGSGAAGNGNPGIVFRHGTAGSLTHSVVMSFTQGAIDVRDAATAELVLSGGLTVRRTAFFQNLGGGSQQFADESASPNDPLDVGELLEADEFSQSSLGNLFDVDPQLVSPYDPSAPDFRPSPDSLVAVSDAPVAPGLVAAHYLGAFEPGGADWTAGWTAYP